MLAKLFRIGLKPDTSKADREFQKFIIAMGLLMSGGAMALFLLGAFCGLWLLALIPLVYILLTGLNFTQFYFFKKFEFTRFFQVGISLLLPFMFQWFLGGFAASGMMMIWAVISLTGAMTYKSMISILWLGLFTGLVIISGLLNGDLAIASIAIPAKYNSLYFVVNMSVLSIITFMLFFNTKLQLEIAVHKENQRKQELAESQKQLQKAHHELLSSEEEIRQNAEELQTINEHLEIIQQDLQEALDKEHTGRMALEKAHTELKNTQLHLLQTEKMASLGQMTAGIAHEINNPINFVTGGIQSLRDILQELMEFVDVCEQLTVADANSLKERIAKIGALKEGLDLAEIKDDTKGLLDDIELGAARATAIVKGLRNFSRLDEDVFKKGDLHEGMDSTLLILNHRLDNVKLYKHYDSNLPHIDCNLGELNQVFMNLISNALDAMDDKGTLIISTQNHPEEVWISIKDSGSGMPDDVKMKIFEPFFTTKEVGKGTGLGLSISYGIVQKHQGELVVESALGKGTEFLIKLPKLAIQGHS